MNDPAFIRIKNWQRFQHYKKRNPPWIKLHSKLLSSRDWIYSTQDERVLMVVCMLLAAQSEYKDGRFDADEQFIQAVGNLPTPPCLKPLIERGFLEYASKSLAGRYTEQSRDRAETEKYRAQNPRALPHPALIGHNQTQKQKRLEREEETRREVNVGAGPSDFLAELRRVANSKTV
jgi:hypothetical protein